MSVILLLASLIFVYTRFNPEESSLFPKCIVLQLTGYKCPGCGSQRAIHTLLNFNLLAAIKYNVMVVLVIPMLSMYGFDYLTKFKYYKFHNFLHSLPLILAVGVIVISWWILRNVFDL